MSSEADNSLRAELELMKRGQLPPLEMSNTIARLGDSRFINEKDVQTLLAGLVRHFEPQVRSEAIRAIAFHGVTFDWETGRGETFLKDLEEMATADPEADCRRAAAAGLGSLFARSRSEAVARLLAGIASDVNEESDVRAFAYTGFLSVMGMPIIHQLSAFDLQIGEAELANIRKQLRELR